MIRPGHKNSSFMYDDGTRAITIDLHGALKTTDGGHQSPALLLLHEAAHALHDVKGHEQHMKDIAAPPKDGQKQYDTLEEQNTITHEETTAAKLLGESVRTDHRGKYVTVSSPTKTQ